MPNPGESRRCSIARPTPPRNDPDMTGFDPRAVKMRPAEKSDCRTIASLYSISSDGVCDYIWTTMAKPGEDIIDVGTRRYEREEGPFSYRNCTVAELNGEIIGMLVAFPMHVDDDASEEEIDLVLVPYSRLEEDDSYYICGMALFPPYRGRGVGSRFLDLAEAQARERNFTRMSLIVFDQNEGAKRLYVRHRYGEVAREPVVPHPLIRYTGDALLMVKTI